MKNNLEEKTKEIKSLVKEISGKEIIERAKASYFMNAWLQN